MIHPSNYDDTFYFDIIEKAAYDQYESDKAFVNDMVAKLTAMCQEAGHPISEADRFTSDGWSYENVLTPSTDYCAYAFGMTTKGEVTTELSTCMFKTLPMGGDVDDTPAGIDKGDRTIDSFTWGSYMNSGEYYEVGELNLSHICSRRHGVVHRCVKARKYFHLRTLRIFRYLYD